jgi:uncharacterized OB-fold protein
MMISEITAYRCVKCGKIHYPFHDRCIGCKSREFEPFHPEGNAKLLTYTQIFNLPWGFDQRFLVIGIVEFENHVRAMGQIQVDGIEELKPGKELFPYWDVIRITAGEKVFGLKLALK